MRPLLLYTVNMAIALVEQTRRRRYLVDLYPRNGDLARALNLPPPPVSMESLSDEDLLDLDHLGRQIRAHASGLELLSIPPRLIKDHFSMRFPRF